MTDSPAPAEPGPVDPDVELASAHLDGEAGADERVRTVEPAVRDHLATFASVADQVRAVPPPPAALTDQHVARAMAAFDDRARVVPLGGPRRAAPPWWQRIPLGAVAAALVVVALVGAIGLASTMEDDGDDTATATMDAAEGAGDGAAEDSADDGDASGDAAPSEESTALDAGTFGAGAPPAYESYDALAVDLRDQLASAPDTAESSAPTTTTMSERAVGEDEQAAVDPCGAVALLGLDPADVVLVRSVVVTSDAVTAVVHDSDDGRWLTVVADATCAVVDDRAL